MIRSRYISFSILLMLIACLCVPVLVFAESATGAAVSGGPANLEMTRVFGPVFGMLMNLFGFLAGIAGIFLNNAIYYTVLHMGDFVAQLPAIGTTWSILRDLGNIVLLFGFLAVGICILLGVNWYGSGKKMIPILLLSAIFINFSLFIAEAIIDVGNLFATQFYTQINGGNPVPSLAAGTGIATNIMNRIGLSTLYNIETGSMGNSSWDPQVMIIGFLGMMLLLVTAFVLFTLAFILITRFIALIFLIIVAPIGFAGLAVPKLEGIAKQWWSTLINQTLTAPVLLLTLYIAMRVITDDNFLKTLNAEGDFSKLGSMQDMTTIGQSAGLLLSFVVAMGLLMACVIISKKMSAVGAGWATKTAGAMSFGVTAFAARNTFGRASNAGARYVRSTSFGRSELGRYTAGVLDKGAKSSFDVRGASAFDKTGVDAGDAKKGGYAKYEKDVMEARTKYAATLTGKPETQEEKNARKQARANRESATEEHKKVETSYQSVKGEHHANELELARLEEEKKNAGYYWNTNPELVNSLNLAGDNLKASAEKLKAAEKELTAANAKKEEATKKEEDINKAVDARVKNAPKEAQREYGERLQNSVLAKIFVGPGAGKAGEYVVKHAGNIKAEQEHHILMTALGKLAHGDDHGGEKKKAAPAAAAQAPAGGAGHADAGHGDHH